MKNLIEIAAIDMTIYKFVLPLMNELKNNGWNISVASSDSGYRNEIQNQGYEVHNIDFVRSVSAYENLKAFIQLVKLFKEQKPDYIHVHTPIAAVIARIAAHIAKVPNVLYTMHGLNMQAPYLQIEKYVCKHFTDYIFTVNEEDRVYLIENEFINPHRIKNLNSVGVDIDKFNPKNIDKTQKEDLKQELGLRAKPTIGFVGRLIEEKGIKELINAFIQIRKDINCQLLLVGSSDMGERDQITIKTIRQKIKQAGLSKDVIFAGQRDDIPLCLSLMDIFVFPSHREGMAVSPLEAMAMELPVITTDIRGCKEEVTFETGILIQEGNIEQLVEAIKKLLTETEKAKAMGIAGRKHVKKYFSVKQSVSKQLKVFERLSNK